MKRPPSPFPLPSRERGSWFGLAVAAASLLVTLVMAAGIWESYYPDAERESLAARRAYFEEKIRPSPSVNLTEARHWRVVGGAGEAAGPGGAK